jgi:hypothetical protein
MAPTIGDIYCVYVENLQQYAELMSLVEKYTETFNQLDVKANFIETIEREEIYNALVELLDRLESSQPGMEQTTTIKVNRKELGILSLTFIRKRG